MIIWLDAHLSPALAPWIQSTFEVETHSVRDLQLRDASDEAIFCAARSAGATVMTKDNDFVQLQQRHGAPPQVIWLTCGNTSNQALRQLLGKTLTKALDLLRTGEQLIEIRTAQ